jgi:hypothetical protein
MLLQFFYIFNVQYGIFNHGLLEKVFIFYQNEKNA